MGQSGGGETTSMLTRRTSPKEGARRVLEILRRGCIGISYQLVIF